jgi:cysteine desulfurase
MKTVYLDNAATTAVSTKVVKAMIPYLTGEYGNPSSPHAFGERARKAIELAKTELAKEIGAKPWEIILTSGGTESNNLALFGIASRSQKKKIIISSIEHSSVYEPAMELQKRGFNVVIIPVNHEGLVNIEFLKKEIDEDTLIVSVMHVNSETGIIQNITEIGKICMEKEVLFHTDALQSFGKLPIDVKKMNIALLSASAHKLRGPKGIGFLYVRDGIQIKPQIYGGGQEKKIRSGTENVAGAVGFAVALKSSKYNESKIRKVRDYFVKEAEKLGAKWNGSKENTIAGHAHISFIGYDGESLVSYLSTKGIMCSTGSACDSKTGEKRVLRAIGLEDAKIKGAVRFVFGENNIKADADCTIKQIKAFMKTYA